MLLVIKDTALVFLSVKGEIGFFHPQVYKVKAVICGGNVIVIRVFRSDKKSVISNKNKRCRTWKWKE